MTEPEYIEFNATWSRRFLKEHANRYMFASQYAEGKRVLDLACGIGYGTQWLGRRAKRIVGGDLSPSALYEASRHFAGSGIHYVQVDAQWLPFSSHAFDLVCSFETIEHLERPEEFVKECHRVLVADGVFLCSTPNKAISSPQDKGTSSRFHVREYLPGEILQIARRYFPHATLLAQESWWTWWDVSLARLAKVLKPFVLKVPRAVNLLRVITDYCHNEYKLESLSSVGDIGRFQDPKYVPSPCSVDTRAPTVVIVASK
jgi:ubiquinone/menaquinone biosynthesis C-methylase UbiE